ncbi:hypothetical protein MK079_04535 [Candidatus Gracilibacteria bacterium]|nr:hypothetical protein [Candidatus Gracilibacteria bacterium]
MDLNELKQKALEVKQKAEKKGQEMLDFSAQKLSESQLTLKSKEDLEAFIATSKNKTFTDPQTGNQKESKKTVFVVFADAKSKFFQDALYMFPVLWTKGFSQNISLKLAISNIRGVDTKEYGIKTFPSLVTFENTQVLKVVEGEEKIGKLVKNLNLDIKKDIESMS